MAAIANLLNWITGTAADTAPRVAAERVEDPYVLRALPNEGIYLYTKHIDNSRIVRESDPQARSECWRLIASAGASAVLLIGVLLPSAYGLLAGYQIQSLKAEQRRLVNDRSALELEEARLVSPARLEELARQQSFAEPGAQKVVYLDRKGNVALNVGK